MEKDEAVELLTPDPTAGQDEAKLLTPLQDATAKADCRPADTGIVSQGIVPVTQDDPRRKLERCISGPNTHMHPIKRRSIENIFYPRRPGSPNPSGLLHRLPLDLRKHVQFSQTTKAIVFAVQVKTMNVLVIHRSLDVLEAERGSGAPSSRPR